MRMHSLLVILVALVACQQNEPTTSTTVQPVPPVKAVTSQPTQITQGLSTPESVLYDPDQDVYFISNINGQPVAADNNGYISRIKPDTLQGEMKWIEGGKPGITLNAPKGMAIAGDTLYVADLTVVRKFNRKTGAAEGEVAIPGSTFLNDAASDGKSVYVSDSGLKAGAGGNFEPTNTDAIWQITDNKPKKIASSPGALKRPNGVEVVDGKVWAVSFGGNELYRIENGKKVYVNTMPAGSLDGLLHMSDGTFLVSSWDGKAVYRGKDNKFTAVIENVNAPADIGYDTKRHLLLIPHFMDNVVSVHSLQ